MAEMMHRMLKRYIKFCIVGGSGMMVDMFTIKSVLVAGQKTLLGHP